MSMRISSALAGIMLLSGCSSGDTAERAADDEIACRPTGATDFERVCAVDRMTGAEGLVLTVHHPDGAFRRLLVARDGRGVVAADGAEQAIVTPIGDREIEVALGGDRYRLPATVKGSSPTKP